jgi:outer membrane biosynthesis protein TonB
VPAFAEDPFSQDRSAAVEKPIPATSSQLKNLIKPVIHKTTSQFDGFDTTAKMRFAWEAWDRRVFKAVNAHLTMSMRRELRFYPYLVAVAEYSVTKEGRIINVQISRSSSNASFDDLLITTIKSFDGNTKLLAFPSDSNREAIRKLDTFSSDRYKNWIAH